MALWLALVLPALPLQLAERALPGMGPLAIVEGPPQRLAVIHCNAPAQAAGVAPGMKVAAAQALARELIALERNVEREQAALAELAGWAYQFSSHVVLQPDGLLLETGGSERLFGDRARLHRAITTGLDTLGYRAAFAYADAPRCARVFALAEASQGRHAASPDLPLLAQADDLRRLPIEFARMGCSDERDTACTRAVGNRRPAAAAA